MPGLKYDRAFMIGFYVDVAILDVTNRFSYTNIKDIPWTDKDRPFVFPSLKENIQMQGASFSTPTELYNYVESIIGNDVNALFGIPMRINKANSYVSESNLLTYYNAFPSIPLLFPGSFSHVLNSQLNLSKANFCIYFKSLNRLFVRPYSNTITPYTLYAVDASSGQLSPLNRLCNGAFGATELSNYRAPHNIYSIFNAVYYNEGDDLSNPELWKNGKIGILIEFNESELPTSFNAYTSFPLGNFWEYLFADKKTPDFTIIKPPDPFDPIDPSGPNTPGGKFDDESDIIGDSDLPSLSASDTGFTRIYIPTLSQVQDLARYLWTDETVVETIWNKIKQFFENPMEAIIGFNLVPVPVPSSGTKSFALMYIDTGVDMDTAANQFVDVDCGTFKLEYYYGSALDYSPYTKVSCFLPYIGMVQLNTDEVMNRTLQIKYRVDIVSGSCVAKILIDGNCIYQYSGHCAITIPISASDFTSYVSAAISVAKLAVGAAVGGAAGAISALAGAPAASQQTNQVVTQTQTETAHYNAEGAFTGASITNRTQTRESPKNQSSTESSFAGLTPANISNTVGEIMGSKPHVQHSGSFSGNSGYLGVRRPFLIIERPNLCLPENYQQLNGFPAMITMLLGECTGYTRVQQVELTGLPATNPEQAEILELLKSGVIF